jgi:hypothetical protein
MFLVENKIKIYPKTGHNADSDLTQVSSSSYGIVMFLMKLQGFSILKLNNLTKTEAFLESSLSE